MRYAAIAMVVLLACRDATAPQDGFVWVQVSTTGDDLDLDGYTIKIDGGVVTTASAVTGVSIGYLEPGSHTVEIEGISGNCVLEGPASQSFKVKSGERANVSYVIGCKATGIEVKTVTTGLDQPIYTGFIAIFGSNRGVIPPNGVRPVTRVLPGSYSVSLATPDNCKVTSESSRVITVSNREVTPVSFDVECVVTQKHIAFTRDTVVDGSLLSSVFTVSSSGREPLQLVSAGHQPAWSHDGSRITYSLTQCSYYYYTCFGGLRAIDPSVREPLTVPYGALGLTPTWSSDGKWLAFTRLVAGTSRLVIAPSDGTPETILTLPVAAAYDPSWSPDGQRIVFGCHTSNVNQICVANKDGTGFQILASSSAFSGDPAWSPDGTMIAFATQRFDGTTDIALMLADGTDVRKLTDGFDPAWSPDGSKLVFTNGGGLFTIERTGAGRIQITTGTHYDPVWRP